MGRKGKEMSNEVTEMAWKSLKEGKTISYVSETLDVSRTTITRFKNV